MKKPSKIRNSTRGALLLSLLSAGCIASSNALLHGPVLQSLPLLRQQQPRRFIFSSHHFHDDRNNYYHPTIFQTSTTSTTATTSSSRTALFTTPLLHMGHSHAHHHHHHHDDELSTTTSKPVWTSAQKSQRFRRRIALWLFCLVAILGPKLLGRKALQQSDGVVLIISILALSSADTLRRNLLYYWQKVQSFGQAIMKHSSGNNIKTKHSSKSNVLQALSNTSNHNNHGGTSSAASATTAMRDTTEADRVTWMGVVINIVLSVGKLVVGVTQHSSVLIADAGHSLSDLISDFITLWSVQIARLPPDEDHPYGHTKFEAIGSLFLSLTLIGTGLSVGAMAHRQLMPFLANGGIGGLGSSAAANVPLPGPLALVMAGISIASKEWLYRITKAVGEKLNSPVVVANAFHHRSDALSSVLALLSIAWAMAGFAAADAAAGLLVAGMIGMTGVDILAESIQQLSDSANLDLQDDLKDLVEEWVETDPDILQVTTLRARQVGSSAFCDVTLETWPDLTTTATRAVEERLKRYLAPALQERTGQWATLTIHAKAPLEMPATAEVEEGTEDVEATTVNTSTTASLDDDVELTASQVEKRVRQRALLQDDAKAYRLQSVQVHYLSPESVSVDITLDQSSSKLDLQDLQSSAQSLQNALEEDLDEIQSARIYLDLIGRAQEHGIQAETPAAKDRAPSASRVLPSPDSSVEGGGDLSLLEVDPLWPTSYAADMQQIWNQASSPDFSTPTANTTSLNN